MYNEEEKKPDYIAKIEELEGDLIKDLQGLIRINSVKGEPAEDAPFGTGVRDAFHYMLDLGHREGLVCKNVDERGGHMDFPAAEDSAGSETMGILCHLDVVPEGSGWEHEPYGADLVDGILYGRGTMDDKGPTMSAFYAVKALKDCGYEPKKNIRIILGLDEETGSTGMEYYKEKVDMPDFAIVPDSDFPLVHGEMGIMNFDLAKKFSKPQNGGYTLKSFTGGTAANMVPDSARAVISSQESFANIKNMAHEYAERNDCEITTKGMGKSLELTCKGLSAHGAQPWKGKNAITMLMGFLVEIDFNCAEVNDFIGFYQEHIGGDLHGERIGCALEDEISGKLVFNVGMIDLNTEKVSLTVNVRCPISHTDEDVYNAMAPVLERYDIGVVKNMYEAPLYFPTDMPMVQTLLEIYRKYTGDTESEPLVIGGGTYARTMDNAIAYGALYPGEPDLMHQKNESVSVEHVIRTAKIYAEAIYRLAVAPEEQRCF